MEQYLEATHAMAQTLAADRPEIPEGLSDCVRDMAEMTPRQLLRHQRQRLAELRRLATEMAREGAQVLSQAPQSVRSVLEAATQSFQSSFPETWIKPSIQMRYRAFKSRV